MTSPEIRASGPSRPVVRHDAAAGWAGLLAGVVLMMALAGLLFVWPLLRPAPGVALAERLAAAENAFAAFIILVPLEAWLGDRAPRWFLAGAGAGLVVVVVLAGAAAASAGARLAWSALGGVGAGLAYGATVAKALPHLSSRKTLCVGVTVAACAGVLALAVAASWAHADPDALPMIVILGAAQAVVIVVATLAILYPTEGTPPAEW
jgi:hypothetical protein